MGGFLCLFYVREHERLYRTIIINTGQKGGHGHAEHAKGKNNEKARGNT